MSAFVRIRAVEGTPGRVLWVWCPACDEAHRITVDRPGSWTWDGNESAPTISPSIAVSGVQWPPESPFYRVGHTRVPRGHPTLCHSYLIAGEWQFLPDCTHNLAGQTVPMVPLPEWVSP